MELKRNILLITNIPTPYRIPLFNELNRQLESLNIKLQVIFGAKGYSRRNWEIDLKKCHFKYVFLKSKQIKLRDSEKVIFTYSGLLKIIKKEKPVLIISNAFSLATFKIWMKSFIKKTMYIIWSGDILGKPISKIRKLLRILLCKKAKAFISYGKRAQEYLISLGVDPDRIEIALNTVDTEFFKNETDKIRDVYRVNTISKNLLCVSYLSERKQVDLLLKITKKILEKRDDFNLEIVGDGPQLPILKEIAEELGIKRYVKFVGYKQKSELPEYFARSACLLFPTKFDIWGLVLNEAMAAGIPSLASVHAGAVADLIKNGETGFIVDFENIDDVVNKIEYILDHPNESKIIGEKAKAFIGEHVSIKKSAQGFVAGIMKNLTN